MIEKIYWLLWILFAGVAVIFYLAGILNPLVAAVLGFIFFGLIFMGMIGVLPNWVSHQSHIKH